MSLQLVCDWR